MTTLTFRVLFISSLVALVLGQLCLPLVRRLRLIDVPGALPHKNHNVPVPLAGGIVIFVTLLAAGGLLGLLALPGILAVMVSAGIIFAGGLWDDLRFLKPFGKLLWQFIGAVVLILLGVQVHLFDAEWMNWAITLLWLVGMTNAFNFVDSMDGLASGLAALAAAFFTLVTFDAGQGGLSLFSACLLGACIGAFYSNSMPARYFLGDAGAQLLGFVLAAVAIMYNPVGYIRLQSWYVPILLLAVPLFDTALVVISRLRRGRPFYQANLDHTYHRLVMMSMSHSRAVLSMHVTGLLLGCLAFIILPLPPLVSNAIFAFCVLAGGAAIFYLDRKSWWS